jgi:amidase
MSDLPFRSVAELAAAIRLREISAREILDHYVARAERFDPGIDAIVADAGVRARSQRDRNAHDRSRRNPAFAAALARQIGGFVAPRGFV